MFYITTETCRRFTLAEVLIMAAINVKAVRPASARSKTVVAHRG